jgi:hypothetical protein
LPRESRLSPIPETLMTSLAAAGRVPLPRASGALVMRMAAYLARTHLRLCSVLLLLSLACFLPGFSSLQPMDRDEPRYAQATKQML